MKNDDEDDVDEKHMKSAVKLEMKRNKMGFYIYLDSCHAIFTST